MRAHFERSKGNDEGIYKNKTKQQLHVRHGQRKQRHSLNPGLLLDILMLFQIYERFYAEEGNSHRKTYFFEPGYSKDERVAQRSSKSPTTEGIVLGGAIVARILTLQEQVIGSESPSNPEILQFPWNLAFPQDGTQASEFGIQVLTVNILSTGPVGGINVWAFITQLRQHKPK